jgi:SAM-dependent methyltransferase
MPRKHERERVKLNLGSGRDIRKGYINCDKHRKFGADMIVNLDVFPYPFADGSADEILLDNTLEHLEWPSKVLNECHRILKKGGLLHIKVPYDNEYGDIHKHNFLVYYFHIFALHGIPATRQREIRNLERGYWETDEEYKKFSRITLRLRFPKGVQFWNWLMDPILSKLIGYKPEYYEQTVLKSLFPANEIDVMYIK